VGLRIFLVALLNVVQIVTAIHKPPLGIIHMSVCLVGGD